MLRTCLLLLALAACGDSDRSSDIVGPFTGSTHRFVVDAIEVPRSISEARALGADLDGDSKTDNQLGMVLSTLAGNGNLTSHTNDILVGGALQIVVEVTADDLRDDPTVGVRIAIPDREAIAVGGALVDGMFVSNRSHTTSVPSHGDIALPVFSDSDPAILPLEHVQLDLVVEEGGVRVRVQGVADPQLVVDAAYAAALQMLAADPGAHRLFMLLFEKPPFDFVLGRQEFADNSLLKSLLFPDLELGDRRRLSFGFGLHARACASGTCFDGVAFDRCFDRIHGSGEADVDCGGACALACAGGQQCTTPDDCQSSACGVDGRCVAPSCSDAVRDGFESDVDCGAACTGCALGQRCYDASDCASGQCGPPCPDKTSCPTPANPKCEAQA